MILFGYETVVDLLTDKKDPHSGIYKQHFLANKSSLTIVFKSHLAIPFSYRKLFVTDYQSRVLIGLIFCIINVVCCACLFRGVQEKKVQWMEPWLICYAFCVFYLGIICLLKINIVFIAIFVISIYFWACVCSLYNELKKRDDQGVQGVVYPLQTVQSPPA